MQSSATAVAACLDHARLQRATVDFLSSIQEPRVGGVAVAGNGETRDNHYPASGARTSRVRACGPEDVDAAVACAQAALDGWSQTSPAKRAAVLNRLAGAIEEHGETLAQLEVLDVGKTIREARGDVTRAADGLRFYAGCARQIRGETIPIDELFIVQTLRRPVGVVGAIIPWNVPLVLTVCKAAPALATGNTLVVKPAESTPLTALFLADLATEAGLPAGAFNVVPGAGPIVGTRLVSHPDVAKVTFTGSTAVGISIAREAALSVKAVALELGGSGPHIVFADADLAAAGRALADGIFYGQGEICSAGRRLLIERAVSDEVLCHAADHARSLRVGDPFDESTDLGSLISVDHLQSMLDAVRRALDEGAELITGGERLVEGELATGAFMQPTLLRNTNPDSFIEQEEVFGPIAVADVFDTEAEAIQRSNHSRFGLSAGVWTSDSHRLSRVVEQLDAGVVWANCFNQFDAAAPFGGVKLSGNAREWSHVAMDFFTELKTVWMPR